MSTDRPSISVVIPSYQRLARVADLVHAYLTQGAEHVVVVLDGPHEGWRRALAEFAGIDTVTIVDLPENVGLARARIEGLRAARGDVVLAVDDDVVPGPGLVDRHRGHHAAADDAVLLGYMPVAVPSRRGRDDAPTFLYARDYESQSRAWRDDDSDAILGSLWGGNVSIRRTLYERAEEYLPSIRLEYNEDLDLGLRLRLVGATAAFDPDARGAHRHSRGLRAYAKECVARGGAIVALEERWGERPAQLTPMVVIAPGYNPVWAMLQRRIARGDRGGIVQAGVVGVYRLAGVLRLWKAQDASARLLRRGLIMRGYRIAVGERRARTSTP